MRTADTYRGLERCMIFRPRSRRIETGCVDCGLSDVACSAVRELDRRPCCDLCDHDT